MWNVKNQLLIRDISLSGILLGLITILNLFFSLFPVLMGYDINFYMVVFALGLIILKSPLIKGIFFIFTPLVLLLSPNIYWINLMQVITEYFLTIWCFFPFLFGQQIIDKLNSYNWKKEAQLLIFGLLFICCWMLKLTIHVIAGYIWWTNNNWMGSFLINLPIIISNILFTIPIFILIFNLTIKISKTYYLNIWNDSKL